MADPAFATADPAFATARAVDELTDEALPGLPMTDVDRVEAGVLADCTEAETTIIAQQAASAKTIEALAFQAWHGTQRCHGCRYAMATYCGRCREVFELLESLGFDEQMRSWAA